MPRQISTAVAAAAAEGTRKELVRALAEAGVELLSMERSASSALEALKQHRPDLLAADEQLLQLEGASLARLALTSRTLPVRPAVILLHYPGFASPGREMLEGMGVRYVEKPVSGQLLAQAIEALESAPPFFPEGEVRLADALLDALGMPDHIGRECLKTAALLCAGNMHLRDNLAKRLYPAVGSICSLSAAQAERSMRHAIDLAWQSNQFENQYRIFADTVDAGRGQPTCGEMISRLADILRLEG